MEQPIAQRIMDDLVSSKQKSSHHNYKKASQLPVLLVVDETHRYFKDSGNNPFLEGHSEVGAVIYELSRRES